MPQNQFTEAALEQLISVPVLEGQTIEYKRDLPGTSDGDKKEFLADATSFANTLGGVIYYGMRAEDGIPREIVGIPDTEVDGAIQRMDSLLGFSVDPRIPGYRIEPIRCRAGVILALVLPKSWAGPHMVSFKGSSRFFARNSAGKYQLDAHQIRAHFVGSEARSERLRRFRLDRLAQIAAGESILGRPARGVIALHVMPLQMLDNQNALDPTLLEDRAPLALHPISFSAADFRHNFDGFITYEMERSSYVQVFRSGAIEAGDAAILRERQDQLILPSSTFEIKLCSFLDRALQFLRVAHIEVPVSIGLSLLSVRGYYMAVANELSAVYHERRLIESAELLVPEVIATSYDEPAHTVLRPAFDLIWAAAGWPRSMNYDEAGNWRLVRH